MAVRRNKRVVLSEEEFTPEELKSLESVFGVKKPVSNIVDYSNPPHIILSTVVNSFNAKSAPSSFPKNLLDLLIPISVLGSAHEGHGHFTFLEPQLWVDYFSKITLNELSRILFNSSQVKKTFGLEGNDPESFVYNLRKKRGKILHETLEKIIGVFSEAPDFVDMRQFFGGLEYNLLVEKGYKEEADFLFNVPLPIFVQAMALYLMDSYTFRQKTTGVFGKTFLGDVLSIAGGENYFVNIKKLNELGLSLKELSRPDRFYSQSEIDELIKKGVIIIAPGEQKFLKENLYEYEWAYVRLKKGLGTSDSLAFAFASLILGPWGPLVLRLHDTLDTIVKGVDDYTYDRYRELLDEADKRYGNIFREKYGIDFSSNFGEFDEVLAASMLVGHKKVRDMFLLTLENYAVERFIYAISKNNNAFKKVVNGRLVKFTTSIGAKHAHEKHEHLLECLEVKKTREGYINGSGKIRFLESEKDYCFTPTDPILQFLLLGQLKAFYGDIKVDWNGLPMRFVATEFYGRLHHLTKNKFFPDRRELNLYGYPYNSGVLGSVYATGFPGLTEVFFNYFGK